MLTNYLLSFLIWFPIAGGIVLLLIGDGGDVKSHRAQLMRQSALAFTVLTFLASIGLYLGFDNALSFVYMFVGGFCSVYGIVLFIFLAFEKPRTTPSRPLSPEFIKE